LQRDRTAASLFSAVKEAGLRHHELSAPTTPFSEKKRDRGEADGREDADALPAAASCAHWLCSNASLALAYRKPSPCSLGREMGSS
jgi:hypothetical protein